MASKNNFVHKQIKEAVNTIRTNVEAASNTDDFPNDVNEEREILEQIINELANVTLVPLLVKLKRRMNKLVTINRHPMEHFTRILLLTTSIFEEENQNLYPYLPYTWICHHWRSSLVQDPAFWTLIRLRPIIAWNQHIIPFYQELFRRSKSAKLDVILLCTSPPFEPILESLFTKNSNRIRRLQLSNEHQELRQLVLSGKHFPSLQGFALVDRLTISHRSRSLSRLLPILVASSYLETIECTLDENDWGSIQKDQIALILSRIRNLKFTMYSPAVAQSVLDLLHNNVKLQNLQFITSFMKTENMFSGQAVFPELQFLSINDSFLMGHIRAPKLSSLDAAWISVSGPFVHPILEEFDYSSIRYLYIRNECLRQNLGGFCILGTKERTKCESLFSATVGGDIFSSVYPRNCFHLKFSKEEAFDTTLQPTLFPIMPRLTGLTELHLLSPRIFSARQEIIPGVPSIQQLITQSADGFTGFFSLLNDSPRCTSKWLKHLSYPMSLLPKDLNEYADDVEKNLVSCLLAEQKDLPYETIESIDFQNCSSPDIWLEELWKIGIQVVIRDNAESVTVDNLADIENYTYL
ncbi:hypothetical protein Clacol_009659 [Clathrus columnatus]|uniref:F-box domain-containing protein n=1 Tax=Clathrus columnatus TaxID=1419009 RepID=A0AAV5AQS2_9AGAM|nr:hypothetical protein Clacol_009659 [Clathrus columnatus]